MSHSQNQTLYDSGRESAAGVNSNTTNPFLHFTSINRPPGEVKLPASDSQPAQNQSLESIGWTANDNSVIATVYPPDAYLHYSPLPSIPNVSGNYRDCLHRLGFKREEAEIGVNHELIRDLKAYLEGTAYWYLRKCDNPAAFKTLVLEFLERHGLRYWGYSQRQHLEEKEPYKGYLYPRDVQRGQSAFLDAVENLFDYKATYHYKNDMKNAPEKRTRNYIDFAAMTGRRVDVKTLAEIRNVARSASNTKASSRPSINPKDERPKNRQTVTSDSTDNDDRAYNVFDEVETSTVLRPNPTRTKWTREVPDDRIQCHEKPTRPEKHSRTYNSIVDHGTSHKRKKTRTHEKLSTDSSTDSDVPLLHKATKKHRLSPPTTRDQSLATAQTASTVPGRVSRPSVISLVSDSDEERPKTIKNEPLSASARAGTLLKVSMHNQPEKLEISVPLGACRTSNQLFDKLTTEWRLQPEMASKINFISARYRWSGEPHGMRRGEALDWELFCTTIREAWEKREGDSKDKCIIEMKLIADD